jgi:inorganic pyrophosphatase
MSDESIDLPPREGDGPDWFEVIVEIPQGSRNKYEIDHDTGAAWLDRHLFQATVYPAEYGFFPETLAEDGDPLDALVLVQDPTFPGCHVRARPVAVLEMEDEKGRDLKVLCLPAGDFRWDTFQDVTDVPVHLLAEIRHFFEVYKDLEPGKTSMLGDWTGRADAIAAIADARMRYLAG